jgi:hypothetical protein
MTQSEDTYPPDSCYFCGDVHIWSECSQCGALLCSIHSCVDEKCPEHTNPCAITAGRNELVA